MPNPWDIYFEANPWDSLFDEDDWSTGAPKADSLDTSLSPLEWLAET